MARIRSLKPEMWQSESVGRLSRDARLLLVGLITQADDLGRTRASSRGLASLLLPFDTVSDDQMDAWVSELEREGMFFRYIVDGATYGILPNFLKHQKIDHPSKSKIPPPPDSLANPRESSRILATDQGSRIKDQGSGNGSGDARAPACEDLTKIVTPGEIPGHAISDSDRWRYQIGQTEWAKAIKRAGGKIGPDSWQTWQGLMDRIGIDSIIETMSKLPATERWPDRVEEASGKGPAPKQDDSEAMKALRDEVQRRVGGDVFVKSEGLMRAAKRYGVDQVLALADHAREIGSALTKELGNHWFNGRPSPYGGWDFYEPKPALPDEQGVDQIVSFIKKPSKTNKKHESEKTSCKQAVA